MQAHFDKIQQALPRRRRANTAAEGSKFEEKMGIQALRRSLKETYMTSMKTHRHIKRWILEPDRGHVILITTKKKAQRLACGLQKRESHGTNPSTNFRRNY